MFSPAAFLNQLKRCAVMGIVNVTGDSFSEGASSAPESAVRRAVVLFEEGADILDLGAESTRPGSLPVDPAEECDRLIPVLKTLRQLLPRAVISVDTRHGRTASEALKHGADIINDVSMGHDKELLKCTAAHNAVLILCHSRGTPQDMNAPQYTSYPEGVCRMVEDELELACREAVKHGIPREHIWLDPGVGFAKTAEQCRTLIAGAATLSRRHPWLWGISRKSFMGGSVDSRGPETLRLEKTVIDGGASVIRTHDVAALRRFMGWEQKGQK